MGADFLFSYIPHAKMNKEREKLLLRRVEGISPIEFYDSSSWDNDEDMRAAILA